MSPGGLPGLQNREPTPQSMLTIYRGGRELVEKGINDFGWYKPCRDHEKWGRKPWTLSR